MSPMSQNLLNKFERLNEESKFSALRFIDFLIAENNEESDDIFVFDKAMADDDGYRISHESLSAEYGLQDKLP